MKTPISKFLIFVLISLICLTFIFTSYTQALTEIKGSIEQYGGINYNELKLNAINNYIKNNYLNIPQIHTDRSIFVGVRRWQTNNLAIGIEVERIETKWKNNDHIKAITRTTGYLTTAFYRITNLFSVKTALGGYSSSLSLFSGKDLYDSGLNFGGKLGLYIPVPAQNLDDYLPYNVPETFSGDVYLGYRFSKVRINNQYINNIDYSGLEISTSLNISF